MNATTLPKPGLYRNGDDVYEIKISPRQRWYALKLSPLGSKPEYLADRIDLDLLTPESSESGQDAALKHRAGTREVETATVERTDCTHPKCPLPSWHRGFCGKHLATDAVEYARSLK